MAKLINLDVFKRFFRSEQIGGFILLICVAISLIIANSSAKDTFINFLEIKLGFGPVNYSILAWINDALMAIFFLLVGLEIKRELVEGELSSVKSAALPVIAALGGMLVPALIYSLFNKGTETAGGWGIPMATDIAFALAIIAMLGKSVPTSLKIFLAALAIVDDLGAILVIAIFYTHQIHFEYLAMAGGILVLLSLMNYFGVKKLVFYLIPGIFLWYFIHHSGIHATIAGVLLAFTIPTNETDEESPLEKLEHFLTTPVNYIIMPIFALANTSITFQKEMLVGLVSPLGLGIIVGLFVGKTIGVTFFSWLAVKLKWADLPTGAGWKHILGLGMLAGIGFTMSIFIALLSFSEVLHVSEAKFAILTASILSGVVGFVFLKSVKRD
ncbi:MULTISPECIES: Na+/H+ antiporter NhaA [unclassified Pedobacter]|uniref:Na+/H+ antiporter NhaA n=1 Tax=unclassified Pedobacter TaxID=2628915 RepID=UPI00141EC612|nr:MULTISPECIES: Na+/H+ antiporter NhaA [unclassified Pedobacter]NII82094.1 NhaA family Na+:H+ antiporter [Pedobacter sp. SG908]NMN36101.1 NhaA family Na+:H+ antiporter [Pedobacter sp. SG918]